MRPGFHRTHDRNIAVLTKCLLSIAVILIASDAIGEENPRIVLTSPSLIEPMTPSPAGELRQSPEAPLPSVVFAETPESDTLASWQGMYLGLLGSRGEALAGFYDPFSLQFAYGSAGVQPYRNVRSTAALAAPARMPVEGTVPANG